MISSEQVCDNYINWFDVSDERFCDGKEGSNLYSAVAKLINSDFLLSVFWITGSIVIIGNPVVITTTIKFLRTTKITDSLKPLILFNS